MIPSLNESLIDGLDFLECKKLPYFKINKKEKTLVLASGNALVTGKILFSGENVIYGNEDNYSSLLRRHWDNIILISASGKKHFVEILKKAGSRAIVLTTNPDFLKKNALVFPRQIEPYTYNITTYLSMILGRDKENISNIKKNVLKLKRLKVDLKKYDSFYFILPKEFILLREMFNTKFDELFGGKVNIRIFTYEESRHAKTIVNDKKELFVSFGVKNKDFGLKENRVNIAFSGGYAELFSLGYYFIGKIQESKPQWFKREIERYCKEASKLFGQEIKPIVEGNLL